MAAVCDIDVSVSCRFASVAFYVGSVRCGFGAAAAKPCLDFRCLVLRPDREMFVFFFLSIDF